MSNAEKIMKAGILIEPSVLEHVEKISEDRLRFLLNLNPRPLLLDDMVLEAVTNPKAKLSYYAPSSSKESIQDMINFYRKKYNLLQGSLLKRSELKSLTSASRIIRGEMSVIGMVKNIEKMDEGIEIEIEDNTGSVKVLFKNELSDKASEIFFDDVIGVHGFFGIKRLIADCLFFPDIDFKEEKKSDFPAIVFIGKPKPEDFNSINYVICRENPNAPPGVFWVSTSKFSIGGVNFFVCYSKKDERAGLNNAGIEILKKRSVPGTKIILEEIPDVLVTFSDRASFEKHKGVLAVSTDEKTGFVLNLQNWFCEEKK